MNSNVMNYLSGFNSIAQYNFLNFRMTSEVCNVLEPLFSEFNNYNDDLLTDEEKVAKKLSVMLTKQCNIVAKSPLLSQKMSESFEKIIACRDELNFDSYNSLEESIFDIVKKEKAGSSCAENFIHYLSSEVPEYTSLRVEWDSTLLESKSFCAENYMPEFSGYCKMVAAEI